MLFIASICVVLGQGSIGKKEEKKEEKKEAVDITGIKKKFYKKKCITLRVARG